MSYHRPTTVVRQVKPGHFNFMRLLMVVLMLCVLLTSCSAPVANSPGASAPTGNSTNPVATNSETLDPQKLLSSLPLAFEQNVGQTDAQVRFIARSGGYQTFLTANSLVFTLKDSQEEPTPAERFAKHPSSEAPTYSVLKMQLVEANANPAVILKDQWATPTNYFIGSNENQWHTALNFSGVEYRQVYPGVDMQFAGEGQKLRYNFVVQPGSDVAQIKLQFAGAMQLVIGKDGELIITTQGGGKLVHSAPVLYQEIEGQRTPVSGQFMLNEAGQTVGFKVEEYQSAYPLIIDPLLTYSTYLGGSGLEEVKDIAVDGSGNIYVTGETSSANFPTRNSFQAYQPNVSNPFVAKLTTVNLTIINGNNQDSQLKTAFGQPLQVLVKDADNNPVSGITVTFTAPSSGASATLASSSVTTDANGVASVTATANASPGNFTIVASVPGETATASFNLLNTVTPPTALGTVKLLPATVRVAFAGFSGSPSPKLTAVGADPANPSSSSSIALQVGGVSGIPAEAKGIIGTLTNVGCTGGGNLRFWTGTTIPNAVNLNVPGVQPGLNLTASFTTPLDGSDKVNLGYGSAAGNSCGYAVDVVGYTTGPDLNSDAIVLLPATVRVAFAGFGSSTAPKLTAVEADPVSSPSPSTVALQIGGVSGIPADAKGIIGTLTSVGCSGGGNLRFWTGTTVPNAVNLNVPGALPGLNLTASFTTPLDSSGKVNLGYGSAVGNSCGYAVDVIGYVAAPTSNSANLTLLTATVRVQYAGFAGSTTPTLTAVGDNPESPTSTSSSLITAGNTNTIPADAKGIIGTLTNVSCSGGGNLRFWTGASVPNAVNLNIPGVLPNLNLTASFTTPLDSSGKVNLGYGSAVGNNCGYAVDVTGYFK